MGATATGPWTAYQQADNAGGTTQAPTGPWTAYQQPGAQASANAAPSPGAPGARPFDDNAATAFSQSSGLTSLVKLPLQLGRAALHPAQTGHELGTVAKGLAQAQQQHDADVTFRAMKEWSHGAYLRAVGTMMFAPGEEGLSIGRKLFVRPIERAWHELQTPGERSGGAGHLAGAIVGDAATVLDPEDVFSKVSAESTKAIEDVDKIAAGATADAEAARVEAAKALAVNRARETGYTETVRVGDRGLEAAPDSANLRGVSYYHATDAPVSAMHELSVEHADPHGKYGPFTYLTHSGQRAEELAASKEGGRVVAGYFKSNPKLLDADAVLSSEARDAYEAAGRGVAPGFTLSKDASAHQGIQDIRHALEAKHVAPAAWTPVYRDLADRLGKLGYDGIRGTGGNEVALFQSRADRQIADLMHDAVAPRDYTMPVTAIVHNKDSFAAKAAGVLGKSFFGAPIERVRMVQNVLTQGFLEAALRAHVAGLNPGDFLHSPIALGRAVVSRVFDHASQLYQAVDEAAKDIEVPVPLEATEGAAQTLDPQSRIERLAAYTAGEAPSDMEYQGLSMRQASAMRQRAALVARTTANDADAYRAGRRVEALDTAIQRALTEHGGPALARQYRQATSLWHDGSSIERVVNHIATIHGDPTEAVNTLIQPEAVRWDYSKIESMLNNPQYHDDLVRALGGEDQLAAFRELTRVAAIDGTGKLNKIAVGVGSLFLGNYPFYRAVWGISSANPSYLASTAVMVLGYRIMARMAVERAGAVVLSELSDLGRLGHEGIKLGYAAALAAKLDRGGVLAQRKASPQK